MERPNILDFVNKRYTRLAVGYVDAWEEGGTDEAWKFIVDNNLQQKEEDISPYILVEFESRGYDMLDELKDD